MIVFRMDAIVHQYGIAPPAFRLPEGTRLGPVSLQVSDLSRSIAYYEDVLGLRVVWRGASEAALSPHDDNRLLVRLKERPGIRPVPPHGLLGLYHFAILLPDRASLGRFLTHLAEIGAHPGTADHDVSEAAYLSDPDGLGVEVYADRPRETWRHDGNRQLVMRTAALDVGALVGAAGGMPWTGMPAGTVIGHVHLHVGDLAAAEAFYHAALGFDKTVWDYPGASFLAAGGYHHRLGTNTWSPGPPADDRHARLLSWDIVVPRFQDAAAARQSLQAAGYEVHGDGSNVRALDPWGTPLRIVADA
jgi:catechol 2,3-dioxygenase